MANTTFSGPVLSQNGFIGSTIPSLNGLTTATTNYGASAFLANTIQILNFDGQNNFTITLPKAEVGVVTVCVQNQKPVSTSTITFDCAGSDVYATGSIIESRLSSALILNSSTAGQTLLTFTAATTNNMFSIGSYLYFTCTQTGIWNVIYSYRADPAGTGASGTFAFSA